ncbi:glycine N-phenylacetyltransferase-like [Dasypus novemcinctus]|uniref:glycine N-phenylacetyltransferase-like n=1 Tax=Dasypus novemcinctus TaxID=9361 RepID=UPI00265FAECE|nr:glycine N-phenylacetyltransferase-like [Dasypus novemcinctus]
MTDDFDHYTNTYQIYSKDPKISREFFDTEVINWKQHLQIQSSQSRLNEVTQNIAATKLVKAKQKQCILYRMAERAKKLSPSLLEAKNLSPKSVKPKDSNKEIFKLSSLDVTHAALVSGLWHFGKNEESQRFIECCIQIFPIFCLLRPEGTPVSWSLMDQSGEVSMAVTMPKYQAQGLVSCILYSQNHVIDELDVL